MKTTQISPPFNANQNKHPLLPDLMPAHFSKKTLSNLIETGTVGPKQYVWCFSTRKGTKRQKGWGELPRLLTQNGSQARGVYCIFCRKAAMPARWLVCVCEKHFLNPTTRTKRKCPPQLHSLEIWDRQEFLSKYVCLKSSYSGIFLRQSE